MHGLSEFVAVKLVVSVVVGDLELLLDATETSGSSRSDGLLDVLEESLLGCILWDTNILSLSGSLNLASQWVDLLLWL